MNTPRLALALFALLLALPAAAQQAAPSPQGPDGGKAGGPVFSTQEQIHEDLKAVPCKGNADRLKAVRALFEKMGAPASAISVQKLDDVENITVLKPGSTPEMVVIGAHYDKVSYGCGAVDNWSGIVAMAHIYRTVKDIRLKKSVLFVGFGREEEGLIGSKRMVEAIDKEHLGRYCAMINIDSLGMGRPQALGGISSQKLVERAAAVAKEMNIPFTRTSIFEADSDSSSFIRRKIPAISLHGLTSDWRKVLHTNDDRLSKVNPASVYAGYSLALALYGEVENSACDAFR